MSRLMRAMIVMGWCPIVLAMTGCTVFGGSSANWQNHSMSWGEPTRLTAAATQSGVMDLIGWAGLALVIAGIVSWLLGNRRRALLMIGVGVGLSVGTLLLLEVLGRMVWIVVAVAAIALVAWLAPWAWKRWKRLRGSGGAA